MEKLIWAIPFIITPVVFATIFAPGAKNWWWLGRAIVFTYLAIMACGYRVNSGLGSGSKGQDVGLILLVMLCVVLPIAGICALLGCAVADVPPKIEGRDLTLELDFRFPNAQRGDELCQSTACACE